MTYHSKARKNLLNWFSQKGKFVFLIRVLTIVYLLFILSDLFLDSNWFLWEYFSIIPPVFYLTTFLLLLCMSLWKKEYLNLIFVILMFPYVIQISDTNLAVVNPIMSETNANTVTLFDWNTEYWEREDLESFYEFLHEQNADIYHLQEAFDPTTAGNVVIPVTTELAGEFPGYEVIQYGELVTLTKLPVVNVVDDGSIYFLRTDLEINDQVISFYNVHIPIPLLPSILLRPDIIAEQFNLRKQGFSELLQSLVTNKNQKIISGDFNSTTSMRILEPLLSNYQDAYSQTHIGIPTTFTLNRTFGPKLWRLDYVLATDALNFLSYQEISPGEFSDHWGLLVEFTLPQELTQ